MIVPVPSHLVGLVSDRIGWALASFSESGETTPEDLLREIEARDRQLWLAVNGSDVMAVILTRVCANRLGTVEVTHCAGHDRKDWQDAAFRAIMHWALDRGSQRVRVVARPGWSKFLKGKGFRETHRILEADIGPDEHADDEK